MRSTVVFCLPVLATLAACSGGGGGSDDVAALPACRTYASSFMQSDGSNTSCAFMLDRLTLSCNEGGIIRDTIYPSLERFVEEGSGIGKLTASSVAISANGNVLAEFIYEYDDQDRLVSFQTVPGNTPIAERHQEYSNHDESGRPQSTRAILAISIECQSIAGTIRYDDLNRSVTYDYEPNSCGYEEVATYYDEHGNRVRLEDSRGVTDYTITSTEEICTGN